MTSSRPGRHRGKRVMDLMVALLLLPPTAFVIGVAGLWVLIEDGRPVFFRQTRVGLLGQEFVMVKLRTMRVHETHPSAIGQVTTRHPLVTSAGRVLRRLRIDEAPQLWNVVRGEMSLVGPRPAYPTSVAEYGEFERRRLTTRPGMTGWSQVNGNTALAWPERIMLDVYYVDRWTPSMDWHILIRTIAVILRGERIDDRAVRAARNHAIGLGWLD